MQGIGLGVQLNTAHRSADPVSPFQDMVTYFMNLSQANLQGSPRWELEYRLTEAYGVPDAGARSMHTALTRIATNQGTLQRYYVYNSVSYDSASCDEPCRAEHVCAIQQVAFDDYATCLQAFAAAPAPVALLTLLLASFLGLHALLAQ